MKEKKLLFSVTKKDLEIQTFRSGGKGGQHQNKTDSGVRIIHRDSGAVGESREFKSQHQNKVAAFRRMAESPQFQMWRRKKAREIIDREDKIEKQVEEAIKEENLKIEYGPFDNLQKYDG